MENDRRSVCLRIAGRIIGEGWRVSLPLAWEVIVRFVQNPGVCGEKNRGFLGARGEKYILYEMEGENRLWAFGFGACCLRNA
jgi:hypothetical protein